MARLKLITLIAGAGATLALMQTSPANAAGPLLVAPWLLGHALGAAARLATLPAAVALAAASAQASPEPYAAAGYRPGYYPPANYYPAPPPYYARAGGYYAPALSYAAPRYYAPARGYYPPPVRYSRPYGAQLAYQSRGFRYRR